MNTAPKRMWLSPAHCVSKAYSSCRNGHALPISSLKTFTALPARRPREPEDSSRHVGDKLTYWRQDAIVGVSVHISIDEAQSLNVHKADHSSKGRALVSEEVQRSGRGAAAYSILLRLRAMLGRPAARA